MDQPQDQRHEPDFGLEHVTVLKPVGGWGRLPIKEIWAYRELMFMFAARDLKVRYRQAVLGAFWAVTQPLMLMVVYSLLLGKLAKVPSEGYPYPVLAFTGIVPWAFFAAILTTACGSLTGSAHLISKIYFPRLIIPISSVGVCLVDFMVSLMVLFGLLLYFQIPLTLNVLAIPLLLIPIILCALGVGTLFAALNATYRDFQHLVGLVIQLWFFATPVVYAASLTPTEWSWLLDLNPMRAIIEGFRSALLGRDFDLSALAYATLTSVLIFIVGVTYFQRVEARFADVL